MAGFLHTGSFAIAVIIAISALPALGAPPAPTPLEPNYPPDVWINPGPDPIRFDWLIPTLYNADGYELEITGDNYYHFLEFDFVSSEKWLYNIDNGTYQWRVKYRSLTWGWSNWSQLASFAFDRMRPVLGPVDDGVEGWSNDNTPTFTWAPATDAHSGVHRHR